MDGVFWTCLGFAPKPFRGGWLPDEDQTRIAEQIVSQLDPRPFARAMERAIPRDLEKLARSHEVIRKIDPSFTRKVADCLSESDFFAATRDDWKEQSGELQYLLPFFCLGDNFEPGATWVSKTKHHIAAPLCTLFPCIAPELPTDFHTSAMRIAIF